MRRDWSTVRTASAAAAAICLVALGTVGAAPAPQSSAAQQLLDRAIAYHDPNEVWENAPLRFEINMAHSEWWTRDVQLAVDNAGQLFYSVMDWNGEIIEVGRRSGEWRVATLL